MVAETEVRPNGFIVPILWMFQRIFLLNIKLTIMLTPWRIAYSFEQIVYVVTVHFLSMLLTSFYFSYDPRQ